MNGHRELLLLLIASASAALGALSLLRAWHLAWRLGVTGEPPRRGGELLLWASLTATLALLLPLWAWRLGVFK